MSDPNQLYTVILLRPDYLCDEPPYGHDIYTAYVKAADERAAVKVGQQEVFDADTRNGCDPNDPDDYYPLLVLHSFCVIALHGFQL